MNKIEVIEVNKQDVSIYSTKSAEDGDAFWILMGRWFASRDVFEAIGEPMFDSKNITWVIATISGECVGFSAIDMSKADKGDAIFTYAYVAPEFRNTKIYRRMIDARIAIAKASQCRRVTAICTPQSAPIMEKEGFTKTSSRGRYARLVMELER